MATLSRVLFLLIIFSDSFITSRSIGLGINYGQIGNNLPPPSRVMDLLGSFNVTRVKLYDSDPNVLSAFNNSDVEFVIGLANEDLQKMTDPVQAQAWVQQHVKPYFPQTKIKCITIGNEILTGGDTQLMTYLAPAMQAVHGALQNLGLSKDIYVTTAHSSGILANSFPPSAGVFKEDLSEYIKKILDFHEQTGSPFLINAYPFFAYMGAPEQVPLNYVLFEPNNGTTDPATNLHYSNMLHAEIDAVYSAMKAMGHNDIQVKVSETGWPSKGDENEVGATPENAKLYNGNLLRLIMKNEGTPAKPSVPIDVYLFALFNENLKPGPVSERNYGLFYPNCSPVYNIGLQGYNSPQGYIDPPRMEYSSSQKNVVLYMFNWMLLSVALLLCSL